jgi:hypothetical protein
MQYRLSNLKVKYICETLGIVILCDKQDKRVSSKGAGISPC